MSRGKVRPNMSGVGHDGSVAWPWLPNRLRGAIIVGGKVVNGHARPWTFAALKRRKELLAAAPVKQAFKSKGVRS